MRSINNTLLDSARTSIFIAHRLRTIIEAGESHFLSCVSGSKRNSDIMGVPDLIIVLKDGQVVEQGTHEELLRLGALYYDMWVQQAADGVADVSTDVP